LKTSLFGMLSSSIVMRVVRTQARAAAGGGGAAFGTGAVAHAAAVLPKAADALAGALAAAAHDDAAAAAAAADWPQRPAAEELVVLELAVLNVLGGGCPTERGLSRLARRDLARAPGRGFGGISAVLNVLGGGCPNTACVAWLDEIWHELLGEVSVGFLSQHRTRMMGCGGRRRR
jgi:hypothetical protein